MKTSLINSVIFRLVLLTLVLVLLTTLLCASQKTKSIEMSKTPELQNSESIKVFSYVDIFREYYSSAKKEVALNGGEICSFDNFCSDYYEQSLEIEEYMKKVVLEASGGAVEESLPSSDSSLSNGEGNYLLIDISDPDNANNYNPYITPAQAFPRELSYSYFGRNAYSVLEPGDIIMETRNTFLGFGHTGIIYDLNKPKEAISDEDENITYVQTIDAVNPGVYFGFIDDSRIIDYGVVFLRPVCSQSVREDAADFCQRQVGDGYVIPFDLQSQRHNTRDDVIDFDYWSCAELVFSAYYNSGLDLGLIAPFLPYDIYYCNFVEYIQFDNFLDVIQEGKNGNAWSIRVFNNSNSAITCEYNARMCFVWDAKSWNGLYDIESIIIPANQSVVISVSENMLADYIAISRTIVTGNSLDRYITVVNDLNETLKRIDIEKVKI